MNLNKSFDIESLPVGTSSFDPLPAGWYRVSIKEASVAKTRAGTGEYIKIRYDVEGPSHGGRVVFGNLNILNPNPKAEEIGRQQLGELMRAIGLRSLKDTDQLVGGSLEIKLAIRESEQYGNSNDIKAFKSLGGAPKASPAAAPAKPKAPWLK
jgi:hypothetical protein